MASSDLFELKNYFLLGNYQAAINFGSSISPSSEAQKLERDTYLYRCYIARGDYNIVLNEIKNSAPDSLQAIRLLATYLQNEGNKDIALVTIKQWISDGVVGNNQTLQLVAGTIFLNERNFEDAFRVLYQSPHLESIALTVQLYLTTGRVDLAVNELKNMQKIDDDATITQLAGCWVNLAIGGDRINEALSTYKELQDKYGPTTLLLNGRATCSLHLGQLPAAEKLLMEALEKNPKDVDTLINLIVCYQHMKKPEEIGQRYLSQVKSLSPRHPWIQSLQNAEQSFDRLATSFQMH
jgi:tetratricopeptide (TPR) repeat protein